MIKSLKKFYIFITEENFFEWRKARNERYKSRHWFNVKMNYVKGGKVIFCNWMQFAVENKHEIVTDHRKCRKMVGGALINENSPHLCNGEVVLTEYSYIGHFSKFEDDEPLSRLLWKVCKGLIIPVIILSCFMSASRDAGERQGVQKVLNIVEGLECDHENETD